MTSRHQRFPAFSADEACPQQSMGEVRDQEIMFEDHTVMNVIELKCAEKVAVNLAAFTGALGSLVVA
jgi:hypothetical protein